MTNSVRPFYRNLPSGKRYSVVGFGCSSIWAMQHFSNAASMDILDTAYENGLNLFDTGPSYAQGLGETRLGNWLAVHNREEMVISTKVGSLCAPNGKTISSFKIAQLEKSLSESLVRLRTDYVDILYLHGPSLNDLNDEVFKFFDVEKSRGRIIYCGVNSFDPDALNYSVNTPIDAVMLEVNAMDKSGMPIAIKLRASGKMTFSATALARAAFSVNTHVPTSRKGFWYLARALRKDPLFPVKGYIFAREAKRNNVAPIPYSLRFLVLNENIDGFFFGTSSKAHLRQNVDWVKYFSLEAPIAPDWPQ